MKGFIGAPLSIRSKTKSLFPSRPALFSPFARRLGVSSLPMADSEVQAAVDQIVAEGEIKTFAGVEVDGSNATADDTITVAEHHKRKLEGLEPDVDEEAPLKKQEVTTDIHTLAANGHRSGEGDVPEGASVTT